MSKKLIEFFAIHNTYQHETRKPSKSVVNQMHNLQLTRLWQLRLPMLVFHLEQKLTSNE
jgi:hypothetical protein